PMTGRAGAQTGRGNSAGGATQQAPQSGPVRVGTTYPAMTYQYDPAKFYIQACSTLSLSTAQTDAGWLTELGIDVAIEPYVSQGRTWYALIVLQGFSSQTEAEPARRQIVQIGNSHVPNAWNTAQVKHVVRTAGTAPAARGRMP
ncbi:MAG TPA: SPOR domain-containing protein, partial [Phycisphaerae bacterium]|nr:SPOR domain-containing protein [Phycisphaerae bacterium]